VVARRVVDPRWSLAGWSIPGGRSPGGRSGVTSHQRRSGGLELEQCPRQDSNLRSRLRRPVKPRSRLSWVFPCSVVPAQCVISCCGIAWFIARTLARTTMLTPRQSTAPRTGMWDPAVRL